MHLKSKGSKAVSGKWKLTGFVALVLGNAVWVCQPALAQTSFPSPLAARSVVRSSVPIEPFQTGPLSPTPDSPGPLAAASTSWEGMSSDFLYEPPDPHGAAGPNGVLQVVNVRIAYWGKNGQAVWGPVPLDGFFAIVGNNAFSFAPLALYDRQSGRF